MNLEKINKPFNSTNALPMKLNVDSIEDEQTWKERTKFRTAMSTS